MIIVGFRLADGADQPSMHAAVIDTDEVEDFALVEVAALALSVFEMGFFNLLTHI